MKKGFTLLELLIVIIIIGVLAVIALVQYRNLSERARTGEAKTVIDAIRTAQRIYHEDHGVFTTNLPDLGAYIVAPPSTCGGQTTHWYSYALSSGTADCQNVPANFNASDSFHIRATRCLTGTGKQPGVATSYDFVFAEDDAGNQCNGTNLTGNWTNW